jgi:hypothetical protein
VTAAVVVAFYCLVPISPGQRAYNSIRLGFTSKEVDGVFGQLPTENLEPVVVDGKCRLEWQGATKSIQLAGITEDVIALVQKEDAIYFGSLKERYEERQVGDVRTVFDRATGGLVATICLASTGPEIVAVVYGPDNLVIERFYFRTGSGSSWLSRLYRSVNSYLPF